MYLVGDADEDFVPPTPRHGKRKPLPADLRRIEVIHELPERELTCAYGRRKHVISEEASEQLDIVPMQIRVIHTSAKSTDAGIVKWCRDRLRQVFQGPSPGAALHGAIG